MEAIDLGVLKAFLTESALGFCTNLLGAVAILVVGVFLSGRMAAAAGRAVQRSARVDSTLKPLAASLVRYVILAITLMAVLSQFGVQTASILAVLGAAGLAIGLALQGTLSNVASGVMLLVLRPFGVGDTIDVAGQSGTVAQIGLFTTELNTPNNVFVSLPNSSVWNSAIVNYTRNPTRRFDLTVGIDYGDDIDRAIAVALDVIRADARILSEPPPQVAVRALGESSVDLVVRGFVPAAEFWRVVFDLQRAIKQRYDAEGITIPFPQRTLHHQGTAVVPTQGGAS